MPRKENKHIFHTYCFSKNMAIVKQSTNLFLVPAMQQEKEKITAHKN